MVRRKDEGLKGFLAENAESDNWWEGGLQTFVEESWGKEIIGNKGSRLQSGGILERAEL